MERKSTIIDITTGSIFKFFSLVVLIMALWSVRRVVAIVLFSIIIASAITPVVNFLQRRRIPRSLGITLVYLVMVGFITTVIILFGQLVSDQVRELAANIPDYYNRTLNFFLGSTIADQSPALSLQQWFLSFTNSLGRLTSQIAVSAVTLFGGLFSFVGILVLTFYLVLEEQGLKRFAVSITPVSYLPYLDQLIERIQSRLGGWVRGQLLLSAIIGSASFIGLTALGVQYSFSLALIAGVTEIIPVAGPILGAIPAILVAFGQSPVLAAAVAVLYFVIQQLENHLIVPKVMQKTTGLNPVVVIVVVLIGAKLAGAIGVILAIPLALAVNAFFEDFIEQDDAPATSLRPSDEGENVS